MARTAATSSVGLTSSAKKTASTSTGVNKSTGNNKNDKNDKKGVSAKSKEIKKKKDNVGNKVSKVVKEIKKSLKAIASSTTGKDKKGKPQTAAKKASSTQQSSKSKEEDKKKKKADKKSTDKKSKEDTKRETKKDDKKNTSKQDMHNGKESSPNKRSTTAKKSSPTRSPSPKERREEPSPASTPASRVTRRSTSNMSSSSISPTIHESPILPSPRVARTESTASKEHGGTSSTKALPQSHNSSVKESSKPTKVPAKKPSKKEAATEDAKDKGSKKGKEIKKTTKDVKKSNDSKSKDDLKGKKKITLKEKKEILKQESKKNVKKQDNKKKVKEEKDDKKPQKTKDNKEKDVKESKETKSKKAKVEKKPIIPLELLPPKPRQAAVEARSALLVQKMVYENDKGSDQPSPSPVVVEPSKGNKVTGKGKDTKESKEVKEDGKGKKSPPKKVKKGKEEDEDSEELDDTDEETESDDDEESEEERDSKKSKKSPKKKVVAKSKTKTRLTKKPVKKKETKVKKEVTKKTAKSKNVKKSTKKTKKVTKKPVSKRKSEIDGLIGDLHGMEEPRAKRMASLNASAIMKASSEQESAISKSMAIVPYTPTSKPVQVSPTRSRPSASGSREKEVPFRMPSPPRPSVIPLSSPSDLIGGGPSSPKDVQVIQRISTSHVIHVPTTAIPHQQVVVSQNSIEMVKQVSRKQPVPSSTNASTTSGHGKSSKSKEKEKEREKEKKSSSSKGKKTSTNTNTTGSSSRVMDPGPSSSQQFSHQPSTSHQNQSTSPRKTPLTDHQVTTILEKTRKTTHTMSVVPLHHHSDPTGHSNLGHHVIQTPSTTLAISPWLPTPHHPLMAYIPQSSPFFPGYQNFYGQQQSPLGPQPSPMIQVQPTFGHFVQTSPSPFIPMIYPHLQPTPMAAHHPTPTAAHQSSTPIKTPTSGAFYPPSSVSQPLQAHQQFIPPHPGMGGHQPTYHHPQQPSHHPFGNYAAFATASVPTPTVPGASSAAASAPIGLTVFGGGNVPPGPSIVSAEQQQQLLAQQSHLLQVQQAQIAQQQAQLQQFQQVPTLQNQGQQHSYQGLVSTGQQHPLTIVTPASSSSDYPSNVVIHKPIALRSPSLSAVSPPRPVASVAASNSGSGSSTAALVVTTSSTPSVAAPIPLHPSAPHVPPAHQHHLSASSVGIGVTPRPAHQGSSSKSSKSSSSKSKSSSAVSQPSISKSIQCSVGSQPLHSSHSRKEGRTSSKSSAVLTPPVVPTITIVSRPAQQSIQPTPQSTLIPPLVISPSTPTKSTPTAVATVRPQITTPAVTSTSASTTTAPSRKSNSTSTSTTASTRGKKVTQQQSHTVNPAPRQQEDSRVVATDAPPSTTILQSNSQLSRQATVTATRTTTSVTVALSSGTKSSTVVTSSPSKSSQSSISNVISLEQVVVPSVTSQQKPSTQPQAVSFVSPSLPVPSITTSSVVTANASSIASALTSSLQKVTSGHIPVLSLPSSSSGAVAVKKPSLPKKKTFAHGWSWCGVGFTKTVLVNGDTIAPRTCYRSMKHQEGDVIRVGDSVLLKQGKGEGKNNAPFVAKITALWEAPDGEMMMTVLWYYSPEHTEIGRDARKHMPEELFASKHRDVQPVGTIEDKCFVLTFGEFCRYRKKILMSRVRVKESLTEKLVPPSREVYPRLRRLPSLVTSSDLIFCCRKVYDYRLKRVIKNPQ